MGKLSLFFTGIVSFLPGLFSFGIFLVATYSARFIGIIGITFSRFCGMKAAGLVLGFQATKDDISIFEANFIKVAEHFFPLFHTFPLDTVADKEHITMIHSLHKLVILINGNGFH